MPRTILETIPPNSILDCEYDAFRFLRTSKFSKDTKSKYLAFINSIGVMYDDIERKRQSLKDKKTKRKAFNDYEFTGSLKFPATFSSVEYSVYCDFKFSCDHLAKLKEMSSDLLIIRDNEQKPAGKYHFDAINVDSKGAVHPLFHAQYGGIFISPILKKERNGGINFDGYVNNPRLPFYPFSLTLLLNLVFMEDEASVSREVRESNEWRSIILTCENVVLGPYFTKIKEYLARRRDSREVLMIDGYYA
jgi:hypothetical protein